MEYLKNVSQYIVKKVSGRTKYQHDYLNFINRPEMVGLEKIVLKETLTNIKVSNKIHGEGSYLKDQ